MTDQSSEIFDIFGHELAIGSIVVVPTVDELVKLIVGVVIKIYDDAYIIDVIDQKTFEWTEHRVGEWKGIVEVSRLFSQTSDPWMDRLRRRSLELIHVKSES